MIEIANSKDFARPASRILAANQSATPAAAGAVIQAVVFKLADEFYGLPVTQVREVLRLQPITRLPKAPPYIKGILSLRQRVVTVIDLRTQLELPQAEHTGNTRILIVRLTKAVAGLIVDGVQEVVSLPGSMIQPAPDLVAARLNAQYVAGVARHGGNLVVLLDLAALFSGEQTKNLEHGTWQKFS
jgi:purine-binding chemotaxis protein CheW